MVSCKNCNSTSPIKNVHTIGGNQRYLCKNCGYRFTSNTTFRKNDFYFTNKAVQLWLEGLNYKLISEILGFTPETISKFIAPYKELLAPIRNDLVGLDELKIIKRNNLFIGFHKKKINLSVNGSGIIIVGNATEIWGVKRKH
jgi:hypothetical protein